MKLKYYLRGVGLGIIGTTIIFMVLMSLNRTEAGSSANENQDTKSQTVAALENDRQTEMEADDSEAKEPEETEKETEQESAKKETEKKETEQKESEKKETGQEASEKKDDSKKETEQKPAQTTKPANQTGTQAGSESGTQTKPVQSNKVRFEIKGGEFSDTVCRKLAEAGLIDDAAAFNAYLVEKDYDNSILPGTYDIPKDATYEEIAVLLTAKVE